MPIQSHEINPVEPIEIEDDGLLDEDEPVDMFADIDPVEPQIYEADPIPRPNKIADSTAHLLMDDTPVKQSIGQAMPEEAAMPAPPMPAETPSHPENTPPPGYEDNPIDNPYAPPSIPVQPLPEPSSMQETIDPQVAESHIKDFKKERPVKPVNKRLLVMIFVGALIPLLLLLGGVILLTSGGDEEPVTNAQISAADSRRKTDAGVLVVAIKSYTADNDGILLSVVPQDVEEFSASYLPDGYNDPATNAPYELITDVPTTGEFQYVIAARCGTDGQILESGDSNQFAVRTLLENGEFYCVDS